MAVKKATVDATMAKVEAAKAAAPAKEEVKKAAAPAKKAAPAKAAAPAKKEEPAKKAAAPAKKAEPAKKAAAPAKKAPAKKAAPAATAPKAVKLFVEYQGGQVSTQDIAAKAAEASGKKAIKELNVYYQPETNMVYYTADGTEGSFSL